MWKLSFVLVIAAVAICINADGDADDMNPGLPNPPFPFPAGFPGFPPIKILTPEDIKNLKPADSNSQVQGYSYSSSSSSETVNGKPVKEESHVRVVDNDNGNVTDNSYNSK